MQLQAARNRTPFLVLSWTSQKPSPSASRSYPRRPAPKPEAAGVVVQPTPLPFPKRRNWSRAITSRRHVWRALTEPLRGLGIHPVMPTGDNPRTAGAIAAALGPDMQAGLLPGDRLRGIAALKTQGPLAMVGDGIDDAPALAAADVGVAMGGGTDVAVETADAAVFGNRGG
jgi:hypothetical protein